MYINVMVYGYFVLNAVCMDIQLKCNKNPKSQNSSNVNY